jgi:puromycin-sensitive aminopeptidase
MNPKAYRLPAHALPRQYDVSLSARVASDDFSGRVRIALDLVERRDTIELHARDLALSEARVTIGDRTLDGDLALDGEREAASIRFPEPLPTGPATLEIAFAGQLNKGLLGLYRGVDGPEQLLCTQCESTDARAIFPCFDEPTFKARFAFRITTDSDATVLANGPLVSVEEAPGGKTWAFAPSAPMSSYLVALVIGDIASTPEETVRGTPLRVWALRGKEGLGEFAQRYTARLLPWYEDYFGAPYHFAKYDQVAVPGFAAGAMENSGLVLFRQSLLLMAAQTASWEDEKRIAAVVAHEFAHMWFGNLVTMRWWDDLWLNEAFAEWVRHKAMDELSPEYNIWEDFQVGRGAALRTDALASTHPIYSPVSTPDEALELFDVITYQKGCAVLRMLESFIGEESFRAGMRTYMREFAEANATGADLWRHLQSASSAPVTELMGSWVSQSGYPVIGIAREGDATLRLSQRRFFSTPGAAPAEQLWQVPLVIRYEDDAGLHTTRHLLAGREDTLALPVSGALRWCYANASEIGFYRQNPDAALLDALLANLGRLSSSEQMGLLNDQWALTRSGDQSIGRFLDTLAALTASDDYHVVAEVVGRLHALDDLVDEAGDDEATRQFRRWAGDAFRAKAERLGFEPVAGEPRGDSQQRVSALDAVSRLARDPQAIAEAIRWAEKEAADPASVDANLAPLFVDVAAEAGDAARYDANLRTYQARKAAGAAPQETDRYLGAFVAFRAPELQSRTLELLDEGVLPQQSLGPILTAMLRRRHAQLIAWDYLRSQWGSIQNAGMTWVPRLVEASGQLPVDRRDELVAFYDANLNDAARMSYARALEAMDQQAEFRARTRDELVAWLRAYSR